jgi:hypothetical protein
VIIDPAIALIVVARVALIIMVIVVLAIFIAHTQSLSTPNNYKSVARAKNPSIELPHKPHNTEPTLENREI